MRTTFTERTAIERGFAGVFRDRLAPQLAELRQARESRAATTKLLLALIAGAVGAVIVLSLMLLGEYGPMIATTAVVLGFGFGWEIVRRRSRAFGQEIIEIAMPEICRFLGDMRYSRNGADESFVKPFETLRLVGSSNRKSVEHHVAGSHRGTRFELVQATLVQRRRGSKNSTSSTVFDGLLIRIGVPRAAPNTILIAKDHGRFVNAFMERLFIGRRRTAHRVEMRDTEFERRFAVYCANHDVARAFVTPGFMQALIAIDNEIGGAGRRRALAAAFEGDTFFLAVGRRKRFLGTSSLLKGDVDIEADIHAIFADMTLLHAIIDRLHGR